MYRTTTGTADDQLDWTPQNPHPDPPVGQILEFGRPDRCLRLGKLGHFWMEHSKSRFILVFWDLFLLRTRNAQELIKNVWWV